MIIEKRKVKNGVELRPETKMRMATLLGVSAALVMSSCASTQPKVEEKSPEISVKKIAEPMDSTTIAVPTTDADSTSIQDSVDWNPGPLGGIVRLPTITNGDALDEVLENLEELE
ncbi:hypothetical protein [Fibrobacter sp. UWB11]|uniref:hypothetical protein n=1 Tax=Fibrobacter sp. UWB11 TaxID=1896202 RepID=UPI00092A6944|nr:hypothetical protein [Fibrobacter sp. UWB11]SIO04094.1 hypothetical protein SAMN05720758_1136 [Fibrobacter sp. UWB11]